METLRITLEYTIDHVIMVVTVGTIVIDLHVDPRPVGSLGLAQDEVCARGGGAGPADGGVQTRDGDRTPFEVDVFVHLL